jgi:hypothetical protein
LEPCFNNGENGLHGSAAFTARGGNINPAPTNNTINSIAMFPVKPLEALIKFIRREYYKNFGLDVIKRAEFL